MTGLIDATGAGDLLGVPKSWVLQEARADRIPHVRLGRYVRFEPDALEDWWRSRRRGPQRAPAVAAVRAGSQANGGHAGSGPARDRERAA